MLIDLFPLAQCLIDVRSTKENEFAIAELLERDLAQLGFATRLSQTVESGAELLHIS